MSFVNLFLIAVVALIVTCCSAVTDAALPISIDGTKVAKILKSAAGTQVRAGVSKVDMTPPAGVAPPLAGYNSAPRRVNGWPKPHFTTYTAFMTPMEGIATKVWAKCLVIADQSNQKAAVCSVDLIASDGKVNELAYQAAKQKGFTIPFENVIIGAAHTHSSFGAIGQELLWSLAPATDLLSPKFRRQVADIIAEAMVQAERNLAPARVGVGRATLADATRNRRGESPYVKRDSVDTDLAIIRVDSIENKPIATLWNFAIHGTCYGEKNMKLNGDIMGNANEAIEKSISDDHISIFINSDAGDISPANCEVDAKTGLISGSLHLAQAVVAARANTPTVDQLDLAIHSEIVSFGHTHMNLSLHRLNNCTGEQEIKICQMCESKHLNCTADLRLGADWLENQPKFTALRISTGGVHTAFVSVPGEAIQELGAIIKNDVRALGFNQAFIFGYSNNHMGYFVTPREYEVGGYEALLTFWGWDTAIRVHDGALLAAKGIIPH